MVFLYLIIFKVIKDHFENCQSNVSRNLTGDEVFFIFDQTCMSLIQMLNGKEMSDIYPTRGLLLCSTDEMEHNAKLVKIIYFKLIALKRWCHIFFLHLLSLNFFLKKIVRFSSCCLQWRKDCTPLLHIKHVKMLCACKTCKNVAYASTVSN